MAPSAEPTEAPEILTTDENIYTVSMTVEMKYNGDIVTSDITTIQGWTIDLIKSNVDGIIDDKFKVSTSFGGDENLITISIDATFLTESDMESMINYADNQLIPDLWALLQANAEVLDVTINDIDVDAKETITPRNPDSGNDAQNAKASSQSFLDNPTILYSIAGAAICCICILCLIIFIQYKRKNGKIAKSEGVVHIAHGNYANGNVNSGSYSPNSNGYSPNFNPSQHYNPSGSVASINMVPMPQQMSPVMSASSMNSDIDVISPPLPAPPQRVLNGQPSNSIRNTNLPQLPESYQRAKTNILANMGGEGFNFNDTNGTNDTQVDTGSIYKEAHKETIGRNASINDVDNVPEAPLPPSHRERYGTEDTETNEDMYNDGDMKDDVVPNEQLDGQLMTGNGMEMRVNANAIEMDPDGGVYSDDAQSPEVDSYNGAGFED